MLSLEEFIKTHGKAAMRIAGGDEAFNECLVLKFKEFMADFDPELCQPHGTPEGYVLMRLRFAVLKFKYKEAKQWRSQPLPDAIGVDPDVDNGPTFEALREAIENLPEEYEQPLALWANGYTQAQIASELDIGVPKVRARVNAAIQRLRRELTDALRDQTTDLTDGELE
jgi:DNA-directed RNA polymerase specialized sigma24 family protein